MMDLLLIVVKQILSKCQKSTKSTIFTALEKQVDILISKYQVLQILHLKHRVYKIEID